MDQLDKILKDIARLESMNDHLFTELREIDNLLKISGFAHGIASFRDTAEELLNREDLG